MWCEREKIRERRLIKQIRCSKSLNQSGAFWRPTKLYHCYHSLFQCSYVARYEDLSLGQHKIRREIYLFLRFENITVGKLTVPRMFQSFVGKVNNSRETFRF